MTKKNQSEYFKKWYEAKKVDLAAKRALRYKTDPEYRAKVLDAHKRNRLKRVGSPSPEGYTHSMNETAEALGVTIWTLREWRKKEYFPEPLLHRGRKWFNRRQVYLLRSLKEAREQLGARLDRTGKQKISETVSYVFANWEE